MSGRVPDALTLEDAARALVAASEQTGFVLEDMSRTEVDGVAGFVITGHCEADDETMFQGHLVLKHGGRLHRITATSSSRNRVEMDRVFRQLIPTVRIRERNPTPIPGR